jgi:transposase
MARVPTIAEEDAKRPNRERECLVGERTRIVNRIKGTLARLGIRNFKPTLRGPAPAKAGGGRTSGNRAHPGGHAAAAKCLWPSCSRDMARLGFVVSQIRESEDARRKRLEQQLETGPDAMVGYWPESSVLVSRRLISWSMRCCHGQCVTAEQWPATPA